MEAYSRRIDVNSSGVNKPHCLGESGVLLTIDPGNWVGDKGYVGNDMITPIGRNSGHAAGSVIRLTSGVVRRHSHPAAMPWLHSDVLRIRRRSQRLLSAGPDGLRVLCIWQRAPL